MSEPTLEDEAGPDGDAYWDIYRYTCPAPCGDPDCAERHPDGVVCHDGHRSYWHRTHPPAACEALQRTNDEGEVA